MDYAKKWAADHGMVLDTSLTLRDEGLSAYHQRHIKQGALGTFLRAIDDGLIQNGSVLIVEGLDRLSRAEPILAQAQLSQIINAGITVVTASDGKEYNRAGLKAQPMDLVYSLLVMIRAHEESDTKSKRVKASIRRLCKGWQDGTYRGVIRNGKDPSWVHWNGSAFELIEDRAHIIRRLIDLWLGGYGFERALVTLTDEGIPVEMLPRKPTTLYKILRSKSLIGFKVMEIDGEEFELAGYYPPILSEDQFEEIRTAHARRHRAKGKGEIPGIITGIGITVCGYCGAAVQAQNLMNRPKKKDGTPQDGHRRLQCSASRHICPVGGGCSSVPVETALMEYCSDQLQLDSLLVAEANPGQAARTALAAARRKVGELQRKIDKITAALLEDDGATPISILRKARELEAELGEAKLAEQQAEERATATAGAAPAAAKAWLAIKAGVAMLDYDSRMRARKLFEDTFERIVLYHRGVQPGDPFRAAIDLVLIAKGGAPRLLRIDRTTGKLIAQEDFLRLPDTRRTPATK